jgi:hypothetical protein
METTNTKPTFTTDIINIDGAETTIINWTGEMQFAGDNCCAICGFKMRGKHSYAVHLSVDGFLLPIDFIGSGSQGFFAVGSECRKQLPATHTIKER